MRSTVERLVLLLSDPSLSERDFSRIAAWLTAGGSEQVIMAARDVRDRLKSMHADTSAELSSRSTGDPPMDGRSELVDRIIDLLKERAGLRTGEILEALAVKLGSGQGLPPKTSLRRGLQQLARHHGESAVLSAAHQIASERNVEAHGPDWRLRE